MESKVVLSMIVTAAMVVSPAFAGGPARVKTKPAASSTATTATGLEALTPKQVVEKTGS